MANDAPRYDRPHMPGYGLLPPNEGQGLLPWSWVEERLVASRNYWISTTRPDGRPHVAPVWGLWQDGVFYFGSGPDAVKTHNLAANPAVMVHLESGDEVVIVEGVVEQVDDRETRHVVAPLYAEKYGIDALSDEGAAPLFAVRPVKVLAWREEAFPGTATRWRF